MDKLSNEPTEDICNTYYPATDPLLYRSQFTPNGLEILLADTSLDWSRLWTLFHIEWVSTTVPASCRFFSLSRLGWNLANQWTQICVTSFWLHDENKNVE